jgi:hypothetical protein
MSCSSLCMLAAGLGETDNIGAALDLLCSANRSSGIVPQILLPGPTGKVVKAVMSSATRCETSRFRASRVARGATQAFAEISRALRDRIFAPGPPRCRLPPASWSLQPRDLDQGLYMTHNPRHERRS